MSQRGPNVFRSRTMTGVLTCVLALSLAQCKDDPAGPEVAVGNVEVAVTAATLQAVEGKTFTFQGAGGLLKSTLAGQDVSVTITNTNTASPTATFSVGGGTITTTVSFGSCRFTVTSFSGGIPGAVIPGDVFIIDPCTLQLQTNGLPTGTQTATAAFVWVGTSSAVTTVTLTINSNGTVTVTNAFGEDVPTGSVTVSVTGG